MLQSTEYKKKWRLKFHVQLNNHSRLKQNKTPECPGPGCLHNCPCARLLASMSVVFLGPVNPLFRPHSDGKPTLTLLSCLIKGKACSLPRSIIIWFLGVASTEEEGNAETSTHTTSRLRKETPSGHQVSSHKAHCLQKLLLHLEARWYRG